MTYSQGIRKILIRGLIGANLIVFALIGYSL